MRTISLYIKSTIFMRQAYITATTRGFVFSIMFMFMISALIKMLILHRQLLLKVARA